MPSYLLLTLFIGALAVGAAWDAHSRRIPNWLSVVIFVLALAGTVTHQSVSASLSDALLGTAVGFALWFPMWYLGLLGAGDVKYFAAGATWVGMGLAWRASLLAALLGGLLGVAFLVYQRGFSKALTQVAIQANHPNVVLSGADVGATDAKARTLPYAVPMGVALGLAIFRTDLLISR